MENISATVCWKTRFIRWHQSPRWHNDIWEVIRMTYSIWYIVRSIILSSGRYCNIDGILPKGPYPPCLRMADRALLAGYPRYMSLLISHPGGRVSLPWRHNGPDSVSNLQPQDCFLNRLFRRRSKKTSKHRVTGLCAWNSPVTGEFPAQMASNAENVSIWWLHHVVQIFTTRGGLSAFP